MGYLIREGENPNKGCLECSDAFQTRFKALDMSSATTQDRKVCHQLTTSVKSHTYDLKEENETPNDLGNELRRVSKFLDRAQVRAIGR